MAERAPVAVGVNVTLIEQLAPPATLDPQVLVCKKSPAFVPVTLTLETLKALLPVLVNVTDFAPLLVFMGWFPKLRLETERPTVGGVTAPIPESDTV
jgi:hypothetical protein